jgi:tellurite methyltransferase
VSWEQTYQAAPEPVWGDKADSLLMAIAPLIPAGTVYDLGMGEGRNGMYFARRGHEVLGIDSSPTAVAKCRDWAQTLNVSFRAEVGDIRAVVIEPESAALVICAMSLQFMKLSESEAIMRRIQQGLKPQGMVYITVFSTDDPSFARYRQTRQEVERHTFFYEVQESYTHYFELSELLTVFDDLRVHHFAHRKFMDGGHPGADLPHYHGTLTYIGKKAEE